MTVKVWCPQCRDYHPPHPPHFPAPLNEAKEMIAADILNRHFNEEENRRCTCPPSFRIETRGHMPRCPAILIHRGEDDMPMKEEERDAAGRTREEWVKITQPSPKKGEIDGERLERMKYLTDLIVETLKIKNPKYGDSWKSKGGFSAFFNLDRKWSRIETLAAQHNYDIFAAAAATQGQPDGMLEALHDLMGYGLLILEDDLRNQQRVKRSGKL